MAARARSRPAPPATAAPASAAATARAAAGRCSSCARSSAPTGCSRPPPPRDSQAASHQVASSGASARSAPGGKCRPMKAVETVAPSAKAGWRSTRARNARFDGTPSSDRAVERERQPVERLGARRAVRDHLARASSRSAGSPSCRSRARGRSAPAARAASRAPCRCAAGSRPPAPRRTAAPRSRGPAMRTSCPARQGSGSPRATRNCSSTRSSPVTSSVTGCSTCSRVFISMK